MASNQENSNEMKIIHLESKDGVVFDVELAIAKRSVVIRTMIENFGEENLNEPIPLINVESGILEKVIEFATHHKNDPTPRGDDIDKKTELTEWDKEFLTDDINMHFELINAANFLDMKDLVKLAALAISQHFKGKNPRIVHESLKRQS